jgi:hypothetical protein
VIELDLADMADELEAPTRRGRPPKVALRQPLAPTSELRGRSASWWMTLKPGESFTARAEAERQRMVNDVIGRKAPDVIDGQWIQQVTKR